LGSAKVVERAKATIPRTPKAMKARITKMLKMKRQKAFCYLPPTMPNTPKSRSAAPKM
jgi:hypothetical protein